MSTGGLTQPEWSTCMLPFIHGNHYLSHSNPAPLTTPKIYHKDFNYFPGSGWVWGTWKTWSPFLVCSAPHWQILKNCLFSVKISVCLQFFMPCLIYRSNLWYGVIGINELENECPDWCCYWNLWITDFLLYKVLEIGGKTLIFTLNKQFYKIC